MLFQNKYNSIYCLTCDAPCEQLSVFVDTIMLFLDYKYKIYNATYIFLSILHLFGYFDPFIEL